MKVSRVANSCRFPVSCKMQMSQSKMKAMAAFLALLVITLASAQQAASGDLANVSVNGTGKQDLRQHSRRDTNNDQFEESPHYEPLTSESLPLDSNSEQLIDNGADRTQTTARGKRTLYACEEKQLEIECQLGESIHLIRANYGRFSIQICNEHGQLDWKVNCMSSSSKDIITNSCQAKQSCQLLASNSIFGDACPGTQKYLEVHYQCVPNSATNRTNQSNLNTGRSQPNSVIPKGQHTGQSGSRPTTVIQPQQQQPQLDTVASDTRFGVATLQPPQQRWPNQVAAGQPIGSNLPSWITEIPHVSTGSSQASSSPPSTVADSPASRCPETIWRQIRWPPTEAGSLARMACPPHAHSPASLPLAASLACLPEARWAKRVQATHCQSLWLRNLTQRLEAGDSPLSALAELSSRTKPLVLASQWPASSSMFATGVSQQQSAGLFGDDIVQIGRVVRRLVDEQGELLNRISDDKQRLVYAREMLQLLVELANNLAHEQHEEAWLDLSVQVGERQRIAGQLVQSLESAAVLLAGVQEGTGNSNLASGQDNENVFLKVTENVLVAIRSVQLQQLNQTLQVTFPSESSTLGTKWMNNEQRFTLHLQASGASNDQLLADQMGKFSNPSAQAQDEQQQSFSSASQSLRVVFLMIRGLANQMEPQPAQQQQQQPQHRLTVNSNLISLSLVADSRLKFAPLRVDLAAPIELVFKHLEQATNVGPIEWQQPPRSMQQSAQTKCVYWDTNISDWLTDGCKLIATNKTHSTCACNHLTTFALLSEWDQQLATATISEIDGQNLATSEQEQQNQHQPKVQLDSVENELILPNNKLLYLAKMLDGHLFSASSNQNQRTTLASSTNTNSDTGNVSRMLIYFSCLLSAFLLAIHLSAVAYNRAHQRRLLGAIPAHPPPALLVSGRQPQQHHVHVQQLVNSNSQGSDSSPTYSSSDYSAALAANKAAQLQLTDSTYDSVQVKYHPISILKSRIQVPATLLIQLLSLELLVVFLVESQNYLQRQRAVALYASTQPQTFIQQEFILPAIGGVTWFLVLLLYYLISTVTCWLINQLIQLNVTISSSNQAAQFGSSASGSSDKSNNIQYGATSNSTVLTSATTATTTTTTNPTQATVYGRNIYGAPYYGSAHNSQQAALHSSISPTSSFSSVGQSNNEQHVGLSHLEADSARLYAANGNSAAYLTQDPLDPFGKPFRRLIEHALPLLLALLAGWLSASKCATINARAYTSNLSSQLSNWPLLVDCGPSAIALLLYYAPTICLLLAGFALARLRSKQLADESFQQSKGKGKSKGSNGAHPPSASIVNPYGSSTVAQIGSYRLAADNLLANVVASEQQQQLALNKQSSCEENGPNGLRQTSGLYSTARGAASKWFEADARKAKFVCTMLLAILALHSITWLTFFAHVHRSLNVQTSNGNQLMFAFAAGNLFLVLLLTWSQRCSLRRAISLAGLSRLPGLVCACGSAQERALRRARFYRSQPGSSVVKAPKVSPSSQSLFLVSQVAQQQQQQQHQQLDHRQAAYGQHQMQNYHYGPNYHQSQLHLYQQLAGPQHIYDSTSALNEQQHRLNMMQLMQQQQTQRQLHQQHNSFTLNRSLNSLHHQRASQQDQRQLMTLKPHLEFERHLAANQANSGNSQLLSLDNANFEQQQQFVACQQQQEQLMRQSGEGDGPLVALGSNQQTTNNNSATFGPNQIQCQQIAMQQQQQQQQRRLAQQEAIEHQLFSQQDGKLANKIESLPNNGELQQQQRCLTNSVSVTDANQHQYCAINNQLEQAARNRMNEPGESVTGSSLASRLQQQQNESSVSRNFRRRNSRHQLHKQALEFQPQQRHLVPSMDDNIYDEANYAMQS